MREVREYLRIAKRWNNSKRTYLLVNPRQAKHVPVSPTVALTMMRELGDEVKACCPQSGLVIGFAETATAIGTMVASRYPHCAYYQTTREDLCGLPEIDFSEEHSHAVSQKLCTEKMAEAIEAAEAVVFVDDEISTGKTIVNMVRRLEEVFPALAAKRKILASVINRVSPENEERLIASGLTCVQLLRLPEEDYGALVGDMDTTVPTESLREGIPQGVILREKNLDYPLDPRRGVDIDAYLHACEERAREVMRGESFAGKKVAVVGTEECMIPALLLGAMIEREEPTATVFSHSTTRSPICISDAEGYPIRSGRVIRSFYDDTRTNFIYDLDRYDEVIVVTDAPLSEGARADFVESFAACGNRHFLFVGRKAGRDE